VIIAAKASRIQIQYNSEPGMLLPSPVGWESVKECRNPKVGLLKTGRNKSQKKLIT
jgi:hypothetical protein